MSIPLILASQSRPRRDVLFSAGICPTIRVSHVDEPAALEREAAALGVTVNDLSVEQRVMILATAKAEAVHQAYRNIADTAAHARGERVVGFPLRAVDDRDASSAGTDARTDSAQSADETKTRDFSGIAIPTVAEPIADFVDGRPSLTRSKAGPLILGCDSMFLLDGECYGKPHSEEVARERLRAMRGATGELWTGHCLIDFASGRMVRGASKATLHFCEYSDLDIERYIATGEPLEVAGSFTLEGFGGAFIDSIEGDPHGIIGLSLPLARRLAAQLGVEWTDLWNVTRSDLAPDAEYDAKTGAAKPLPPKENVHQPGDGWVDCARGLANSIDMSFKRIQFTPDLLPSDVVGVTYYDQKNGEFEYREGPIFASIVLADEINRASPKTQSALLEVMEEQKVTVDGETHAVPQPFMVIATQNPIEQLGTYKLPEAQMDRFLIKTTIGYPSHDVSVNILKQVNVIDRASTVHAVFTGNDVLRMRAISETVRLDDAIIEYIVRLVEATRHNERIQVGSSMRGALALTRCARVWAASSNRGYVVPDDVKQLAVAVLAHRITLTAEATFAGSTPEQMIEQILNEVPSPTVGATA